jgi:CRP-like cAMP-binding protein
MVDRAVRGFLEGLGPDGCEALRAVGTERTVATGRWVYDEGTSAPTLDVVLHGRLKVLRTTMDGTEVLLALRGPGDLLGEMSTLVGAPRSASVIAIEPVRLLVVPQAEFERLLATHPDVAPALIRVLVERLRETNEVHADLSEAVPVRIGRMLLRLADRFGAPANDGAVVIDIPLTQDELAGLTASSRGATAIALRGLRAAGLVETGRRRIVVLDPDALRARVP